MSTYQNGYQGNSNNQGGFGGNFWQGASFQLPLENREIIDLLKLIQSGQIAAAKHQLDESVAGDRWVLGVLTHLQRKEQEEARLELQKAAQKSRIALDILKLVQAGQLAQADQLHRQAAELQRWRVEMLRLLAQGEIEEAKNKLQERIHNERMTLAWVQHNQRVFIDQQRLLLDQGQFGYRQWADGQRSALDQQRFGFDQAKFAHQKGVDAARFGFDKSKFTYQQQIDVQRLLMQGQQVQQGWMRVDQSERQLNKGKRRAQIALIILGVMILGSAILCGVVYLAMQITRFL